MALVSKKAARFSHLTFHFLVIAAAEGDGVGELLNLLDRELNEPERLNDRVVKLTFFLGDESHARRSTENLRNFFRGCYPAAEILIQPPLFYGSSLLLAWVASGVRASVRYPEDNMTILAFDKGEMVFVGRSRSKNTGLSTQDQFSACFKDFQERLSSRGLDYSNVAKTWTYFGDATRTGQAAELFKSFNLARADFFSTIRFNKYLLPLDGRRYPANTGVGVYEAGSGIGGIACNFKGDAFMFPLENPMQMPASEYPAHISSRPALFARGMAIVEDLDLITLVSGTGSVIDGETTNTGSAEGQAEKVLDIVSSLISKENLMKAGIPVEAGGLETLSYCVVYVKDRRDFPAVKSVCDRRLSERLPVVYVEAELCRDNLLVEVEGAASMTRSDTRGRGDCG